MTAERIAVWLKNAYEAHDRDEFERALSEMTRTVRELEHPPDLHEHTPDLKHVDLKSDDLKSDDLRDRPSRGLGAR